MTYGIGDFTRGQPPFHGFYRTSCACRAEREFKGEDKFPRCPECRKRVYWVLLRRRTENRKKG